MFYRLFYFQFLLLGWAGNPSACTVHLCSARSEYRQSLWLPSMEPTWGGLSWAGNGVEMRRESSCPAPISCVGWQGWPARETESAPPKKWGQSHWPEILEQIKLSSALVQRSRTLCIFFLAQIIPITRLIYSPSFLTLSRTTLWSHKCWLSDWERENTNTKIMIVK